MLFTSPKLYLFEVLNLYIISIMSPRSRSEGGGGAIAPTSPEYQKKLNVKDAMVGKAV